MQLTQVLKPAAVLSSVILFAGYVAFHAGVLDGFVASPQVPAITPSADTNRREAHAFSEPDPRDAAPLWLEPAPRNDLPEIALPAVPTVMHGPKSGWIQCPSHPAEKSRVQKRPTVMSGSKSAFSASADALK